MGQLDLDTHELELLRNAVRTVDLIEALQATIDELGPLVDSPQGVKCNPSVVEVRQQRLVLARLIAQLRLPAGIADGPPKKGAAELKRPQRRGTRGVYAINDGAS